MENIPTKIEEINFLQKPNINTGELNYIEYPTKVYANLFEIILQKPIILYQYPYKVIPEIESGDEQIREKIFKSIYKQLKEKFDNLYRSGDSIYSTKKVEDLINIKTSLFLKKKTDYIIEFQKYTNKKLIKQEDLKTDDLTKQFIEIIIKDILNSNPKLESYKNLFLLKDKKIIFKEEKLIFYPGFITSFMEIDGGSFLNVTLKNKISSTQTILEYLEFNEYENYLNDIKNELIGESFKVSYNKGNYKIDDIIFDKNPENQYCDHNGKSKTLIQYYEDAHKIKIKNKKQPLILVRKKGPQNIINNLYFIPELCFFTGIDDETIKNKEFMQKLAKYTKLSPEIRVQKRNEFLQLFKDDTVDKNHPEKLSSLKKSEKYGIEIKEYNKLFTVYYMKQPKIFCGDNIELSSDMKTFPILEKVNMKNNWLFFYEENNYYQADNLAKTLVKASEKFVLKIKEPKNKNYIELKKGSNVNDWITKAEKYFGENIDRKYDFVLFLINDEKIYPELKFHSLIERGYISQVVSTKSIKKKGFMSVCSKILIQINSKLGGVSYKIKFDKNIYDRKIMTIGIDSSRIKNKGIGIALVATKDKNFCKFFSDEINKKQNEKNDDLTMKISSFLKKAINTYKNVNNEKPKNIIIYRQGVSLKQKQYLKSEILKIDEFCKKEKIGYYYILVNKKTTFKFFEIDEGKYYNPYGGLLIIDKIIHKNFFEFYIQPQEVNQEGSATPTCFHVAYGDMNYPEIIPKFTFDLCHLYSNWQGAIRVPNVLKQAEKLSKIIAQCNGGELNPNIKDLPSYL